MILVTGATGMTGQVAAAAETAIGDLGDFAGLHHAAGVTGIVHTACTFTDAMLDVAAMGVLLDSWGDDPFVFISSLDVYGAPQQIPVTVEHPLVERAGGYEQGEITGYAYGKVLCERMLAAKAQTMGRSDYASLRAPHIWGPHPKARRRLLHERIAAGEPVVLPGADEAEWSRYGDAWIDVRDLARIAADCLEHPPSTEMNVLSGHFVWHDLLAQVIRLIGSGSTIEHRPLSEIEDIPFGKPFYAQTWRFADQRLKRSLAYEPQWTLEETLRDSLVMAG